MSQKQIIILSSILGILALGILLKFWFSSMDDVLAPYQTSAVAIAGFDPAKVERILIARGILARPVELVKENGLWKAKSLWNAKADPEKVNELIQKLRLAKGELRGTGKKLFPDFGIQDENAFSIKFLDAGKAPLLDLRLGIQQAGPENYFVRKASSEEIYLVDMNMAELLGIYTELKEAAPSSEAWADLSLFSPDPEKVTKITISHLGDDPKTMVLGLTREADTKDPAKHSWKFLRKDMALPVDPDKVMKFIAVLGSIKAQKVVDPVGRGYGLEKPFWQLGVSEGNQKVLLNAGTKNAKDEFYYVRSVGGSTVFALEASYFDDLNVDDTHFVKSVTPSAEAKKRP